MAFLFLAGSLTLVAPLSRAQEVRSSDYVVKIGDELEVTVYQEKDLSGLFEVDTFGNITMPLVGDINVEGLRLDKARDEVIRGLRKYIIDPQVSIICKKQAGGTATIFGQIEKPGSYEIIPNMTLTQLIAKAGAFTELADPAQIRVLRTGEKGVEAIGVNLSEVFSGKSQDVILQSGDVVLVPQELQFQGEGKVTILGAVRNPGTYSRFSGMSLIQLVATAGDFSTDANLHDARIIRSQKDGTKELIAIDITEIFKGETPDVSVLADDVVVVAKEDSLESARVTLMGQVRKPGIYAFRDGLTLLELVAMGGDFAESADPAQIRIFRTTEQGEVTVNVDLSRVFRGESTDVALKNGDVVFVAHQLQFQEDGKVTVVGAVQKPGTYPRLTDMSLVQLIAAAGDLTDKANTQDVRIIRTLDDGVKQIINIDIGKVLAGEERGALLLPGDLIVVGKDDAFTSERVTLMGQVRKPGTYSFRRGMTLLGLVAMGGDFTDMANISRIKIIRKQEGASHVILVNVRRILSGRDPDVDLEPYDVVSVPEALF